MFLKAVSYAHRQHLFDKNTAKTVIKCEILLQFKITDFYVTIFKKCIPVMVS